MEQDNCGLAALVRKLRSLGHWRLVVQQAHFRGQLSRAEKVSATGGRPRPAREKGGTGLPGCSCCAGVR